MKLKLLSVSLGGLAEECDAQSFAARWRAELLHFTPGRATFQFRSLWDLSNAVRCEYYSAATLDRWQHPSKVSP